MLVAVELGVRKDCIESNIPAGRLDVDDENFFDRIPLPVSLASLQIAGFPDEGWLEFKASCMWDRGVEILTDVGAVHSSFNCGLEQGNPDSPKQANLVAVLKHMVWKNCNRILKEKYTLFNVDELDEKSLSPAQAFWTIIPITTKISG